jgi:hypothetical protein
MLGPMAAAKPPPDGEHIPDLSLPPAAGPAPRRLPGKAPPAATNKPALAEDDIDWMEDFGPVPAPRTTKKPQGRQPLMSADFDWMEDGPEVPARGGGGRANAGGDIDMDWLDSGSVGGPSAGGASGGGSAYGGGGFEFGDDFDDDLDDDRGGVDVAAGIAANQPKRDLPSGTTPTPEDLELTEAEVATVSGYGPKPVGWYLTPTYAVRVFQRRRIIDARLADLRRQLEQVETERDLALSDVAANWRPRLANDDRFQPLFQRVDDAESRLRVETAGMADANAQYREQVGQLAAQAERFEQRRAGLLDVEAELESELRLREDEHRRLAAQVKRIQIVLRNASQLEAQARDPAAGVRLPPDHAARVANAQQQLPIAQQAEAAQRNQVKEATDRLREARANTQVVNKELRQLDAQRRQIDQHFTQESSTRSALVADGERQKRTAWADVTRALLTGDLGAELSEEEVAELKAQDAKVRRVATEFHRHSLAVDAYDRDAYKTGFVLMGVVGGGLLVLVLLAIGFSVFGGADDGGGGVRDDAVEEAPADDGEFNATEEEWEQSK